ncbi:ParA family protein [Dichotomicrobium thermohalophilum]|uniref:Cellulose biosynthesis protein BcsQ n=1 Tax=Dichotomicrobium thermohalophilum TaxID=933063 RepID=A0A397Q3Z5_9HYPH|nr:ParA family protein [Dichotomicrobium thermohalophilum]RIA55643.1 cellulose biosynthesis protein BcsQ [Dichotomicrobium thermohalophilum]
MGTILAVANRKGGVGKSTVATMVAHAFSVWGEMRVLLIDVDAQANASLILIGGENWVKARKRNATLADYIYDFFPLKPVEPASYILPEASDLRAQDGGVPPLTLMPGSLEIEDREHEIMVRLASQGTPFHQVEEAVTTRFRTLLRHAGDGYDLVILDCPPGISFSTRASIAVADIVLVPFRPDYVSLFAVDRIGRMIEECYPPRQLKDIPMDQRRYVTLANMYRETSIHDRLVDEMAAFHPIMETRIPQTAAIANAFDWEANRRTIRQKYKSALPHVETLYSELLPLVERRRSSGEETSA